MSPVTDSDISQDNTPGVLCGAITDADLDNDARPSWPPEGASDDTNFETFWTNDARDVRDLLRVNVGSTGGDSDRHMVRLM